ncbi:MAG: branched-chain amino acid ABC transporter permease, partial [Ilumatobacteraceae bacterium]
MSMRVVRGTPASKVFAVVAVACVAVLAALPSWGSLSLQRKMVELFTLLALAAMWNLLAGFAGVVSVGQQVFVGLGAYSMIALVNVHGQNLY